MPEVLAGSGQETRPRAQRTLLRFGSTEVALVVVEAADDPRISTWMRFLGGRSEASEESPGAATLLTRVLATATEGLAGEALEDELRFQFTSETTTYAEDVRRVIQNLTHPPWVDADRRGPAAEDPIESARNTLIEGLSTGQSRAPARADEALYELAYGNRAHTGQRADAQALSQLDRESLASIHSRQISLDRLVLGVAGPVTLDAMTELWAELLADMPLSDRPYEAQAPAYIQPPTRRLRLIDQPEAEVVEIRLAGPGARFGDPDFPALDLWSALFGAGGTGLLSAALAEEAGRVQRSSAGFEPRWNRRGLFMVSMTVDTPAAVDALEHTLEALESAGEALHPETLGRARSVVEARYGARSETAIGLLEMATDLALHGFPEDFVEQHLARVQRLTAEEVRAALERHLEPDKMLVVVLGPAEELAARLDPLGQLLEETSVVQDLLDALGGRQRWADVRALEAEINIHFSREQWLETHQWQDLAAPRFRVETTVPGGTLTAFLDGDRSWLRRPEDLVEEKSAEEVALIQRTNRRRLWNLLHQMATDPGLEVREEGDGVLSVLHAGVVDLVLELDEHSRPVRIRYEEGGAHKTFHYSQWQQTEGLWWPAQIVEEPRNFRFEVTSFRPLKEFDPSLVAR